jgi:hypothetical protein
MMVGILARDLLIAIILPLRRAGGGECKIKILALRVDCRPYLRQQEAVLR